MSSILRKVALYLLGNKGVHDLVRTGEATITARMHARGVISSVLGNETVGVLAKVEILVKQEQNYVKRRAAVRALVTDYTTNTSEVEAVTALLLAIYDNEALPVSKDIEHQRRTVKRLEYASNGRLDLDELLLLATRRTR